MQLYLAKVDRVGVVTPEDQLEDNTETVRLIGGHRGTDIPLCYIKRSKMLAGEYLIFYRAAFRSKPSNTDSDYISPMSAASSKMPQADRMDD